MQRVKVAVVEDHTLFAESLVLALGLEGYDVRRVSLGEPGRDISTLLPSILRSTPRVVLLDLDLGRHGNGARLVEPLTRSGTSVLVVTGNTDRARWGEVLAHGAKNVLPKSAPSTTSPPTSARSARGCR